MANINDRYDAVVCGAGIAGGATAHALVEAGLKSVAPLDNGPPLGLTSDKSTECYRNWWPGPGDAMVALMSRSIDLMEHHAMRSGNCFQLGRRGYVFATARQEMIETFEAQALEAQELGAGQLRYHRNSSAYQPATPVGFESDLDGADLILDQKFIRQQFPYLNGDTVAVLHARRCGSLSAQTLGMYLLEQARERGVSLISAEATGFETEAGKISGVEISRDGNGSVLKTETVVLSTGPYLSQSLKQLGCSLPVSVEKHIKISVPDPMGIVPREIPLVIWTDPIHLAWTADEREALSESEETRYLLQQFPAGVHGRPVGAGDQVLMYWTYDCELSDLPQFPLTWDDNLPEITFRGMAKLLPGLKQYFDNMPRPYVDGGYYTKAPDNRPMIGPLPIPGSFINSAFSGFGIMASCGAAELVTKHISGQDLPHYAAAFTPARFDDPEYCRFVETWDASGQL